MKLKDFDFRIWDNIEKKYIKTPHGLYIENTEHNDASSYSRIIGNYEQRSFYIDYPFNDRNNEYYDNEESLLIELFTGLYDKNGKKIYEGDILYYFKDCSEGEVFKYQVLFKEGAFYLFESYDGFVDDEDLIAEFDLKELQVMGNIHENKELLKVKDDEAEENDIFFKGNMIVWLFGNYYSVYEVVKAYEESYIISDLMGRQIEIDPRVAMNGGYKDAKDDLFLWYFEVMENEEIKIYPKKLTYNQMLEECKKNDIYIIKPLYSLGYTYNNNREDFKNYN
ncbi:hypothetical protein P8K93_001771 [Campylobacter coli]|nr:hypothetical protein [Campylobacter coli]